MYFGEVISFHHLISNVYFRAHNVSLANNSEPCLCLRIDLKSFEECSDDWELKQNLPIITQIRTTSGQEVKASPRLHGIFNQVIIDKYLSFVALIYISNAPL